jgi:methylmalonyl-CoA mutase N-terminal domain/subunit
VNEFVSEREEPIPILQIDERVAEQQLARVARLRRTRNQVMVSRALARLRKAAAGTENTMPALLDAVRAYATVGEMCDTLREVWGEYLEEAVI